MFDTVALFTGALIEIIFLFRCLRESSVALFTGALIEMRALTTLTLVD